MNSNVFFAVNIFLFGPKIHSVEEFKPQTADMPLLTEGSERRTFKILLAPMGGAGTQTAIIIIAVQQQVTDFFSLKFSLLFLPHHPCILKK